VGPIGIEPTTYGLLRSSKLTSSFLQSLNFNLWSP